jgi:hypothetical protein
MKKLIVMALVAASAIPLLGCHRPKEFEANVEITRTAIIRKDESGVPLTSDAEFSYVECPGTQIEVIRGGKEFSECLKKYKVGDKVKVKMTYAWDAEGFWDYDVHDLGDCKRPPDPNDEASYKMVRDCSDWNVNGTRVGFQCKYTDKVELNKKCPWFKKR